jgi:NAD(P)-dependent dehydrogenase (short-subunit alcohol dehydrogenase family)
MADRFRDKAVLVLGASTEGGIGQAIARRFASEGAIVTVSGLGLAPLETLAGEISGKAMECDIREEAQIVELIELAKDAKGELHVAVNAAGLAPPRAFRDFDSEYLILMAQIHFVGPALFIKNAAEALVEGGSIVNFSSLTAYDPRPRVSAYGASKRAGDRIVEMAAVEYAYKQLRINGVMPSLVPSPMSYGAMKKNGVDPDAMIQDFVDQTPMGRVARPEDIAAMVAFLASDECFETGQIIPCTGGNRLLGHPRRPLERSVG